MQIKQLRLFLILYVFYKCKLRAFFRKVKLHRSNSSISTVTDIVSPNAYPGVTMLKVSIYIYICYSFFLKFPIESFSRSKIVIFFTSLLIRFLKIFIND